MEVKQNRRTLFSFAGRYKYFTIISCVLSAISSIIALVPYVYIWIIIKKIFEVFPEISNLKGVEMYAMLAVKYSVLSIVLYFFALLFSHLAAFRIARNMKSEILHHISNLSLEFFNNIGTGKLRRIIDESTGETETFLAHQLPDFCSAAMTPLGILGFLFYFDWRFGLLSVFPLIIGLYFLNNMMNNKKLSENLERYQTSLEKMNNEAVEYIRGIPIVKTFQQTIYSFRNFYDSIMEYKKFVVEYTMKTRKSAVLFFTFINGIFLFLISGGIFLINNSEDFKTGILNLIFYILITPLCAVNFLKIMFAGEAIMLTCDSKNRILNILDKKVQNEGNKKVLNSEKALEIKNLYFKYKKNGELVLNNLSLKVNKLNKIAIVGFSGSGKSTIVNLIARFWDNYQGEIKIFGRDIKEIDQKELMGNISFLFQRNNIFKGTILDNIRIGKSSASRQEVLEACQKAMCNESLINFQRA
ncbi:ABC transporter ATP-binding protein [Fusobacterium sp. MFO224]|uniref:ABC transporter ATP-binding protein n=1 Tax=Fusobacterium sp. MFO224 TaxID=3378070 RepID=UPI003853C77F